MAALLRQPGAHPQPLPGHVADDEPRIAEVEGAADWWSDEEEEPRQDPELEMNPAAALPLTEEGEEEDAWEIVKKKREI